MAHFIRDHINQSYEVLDENYKYLATVTQHEQAHMYEVEALDGEQFYVFVSDVRSVVGIIETTVIYGFWGGSTVKHNDSTVYLLHYEKGDVVKSTFYKSVYQWVHSYTK